LFKTKKKGKGNPLGGPFKQFGEKKVGILNVCPWSKVLAWGGRGDVPATGAHVNFENSWEKGKKRKWGGLKEKFAGGSLSCWEKTLAERGKKITSETLAVRT